MSSNNALRRRAAWTTLQPHLDKDSCIGALWLLEKEYQRDDTCSLIKYIDVVVERYQLADGLKKKLYFTYFNLLKKPGQLSQPDPLPLMQQQHNPSQAGPQVPAAALDGDTGEPPPKRAKPMRAQKQTPNLRQQQLKRPINSKMVVFDFMITHMLKDYPGDSTELFAEVMANASRYELPVNAIQELHHWISSPKTYLWLETFNTEILALIVHIFYVALCNLMGPVAADKLWHRVLAAVEEIPEARSFPPRNFF